MDVHNVEIQPGAGKKQLEQQAHLLISGIDGNYTVLKMASGEIRKIDSRSLATIGFYLIQIKKYKIGGSW